MNIIIRNAGQPDAETIARIYNQGIEERGATFETEPRTADDIASKLDGRWLDVVIVERLIPENIG
jgi:L-amino acid N-acyltransferase YncA